MTVGANNGIATFINLTVDLVGTGFTMTATSGDLTPGISDAFDVFSSNADALEFVVLEVGIGAPNRHDPVGIPLEPEVHVVGHDLEPRFSGRDGSAPSAVRG